MRAKSNNISSITKKMNAEMSSMEPIEEEGGAGFNNNENSESNKSKSKSMHDISKGMIQPNVTSQVNKTVNYEIYLRDKEDCPQNNHLVNKKELVYSVNYPHCALNLSSICNLYHKNHEQSSSEFKVAEGHHEVDSATQVNNAQMFANTLPNFMETNMVSLCTNWNYYTTI